ncbi:hypothetical protein GGS21DRAFT_513239 [Xylaria nigripes]|nr:hypothetical protein GGS21DRAFT_513239 [Xylaria nigripes]
MTGCSYGLNVRLTSDGWVVENIRGENASIHNHPLLEAGAFIMYRSRALVKRKDEIISWWNTCTRPVQILARLRASIKEELKVATEDDVRNLLVRHQREELHGLLPIEWLYTQIT